LDLEKLFEAQTKGLKLDVGQWRFPPVSRDVAYLADKAPTHDKVLDAVARFKRKRFLRHARLFDVYEGERLPEGKKSMAYTFAFQSQDKTLTDQEVEQELEQLNAWLAEQLSVQPRV